MIFLCKPAGRAVRVSTGEHAPPHVTRLGADQRSAPPCSVPREEMEVAIRTQIRMQLHLLRDNLILGLKLNDDRAHFTC